MANTYEAIATTTVGSGGSSSVVFSSIPQTYTDLVVVCSVRTVRTANVDTVYFRFNDDNTAGNYSAIRLIGDGGSASSASNQWTGMALISDDGSTVSTFGNTVFYIPNYTGSNQKSVSSDSVSENNATTAYQSLGAGLWNGTAAITKISITGDGWPAKQYSTFTLYGIKNS